MNRINNKKLDYVIDKIYEKNLNLMYTYSILDKIQNNEFCQKKNLFKLQSRNNKPNYFKNIFKDLKSSKSKKEFYKEPKQLLSPKTTPQKNINLEKLKSTEIKQNSNQNEEILEDTKLKISYNNTQNIKENIDEYSEQDTQNINENIDEYSEQDTQNINENIDEYSEQNTQNSRFFTIKNTNNGDLIIEINHIDYLLFAVCIILYENFCCISDKEKFNFIKDLKYKMALDLDKKNLYEKYNYRHKRFRKTDLQNSLIENNKVLHKFFYNYLGDYFGINLIEINNNMCKYINNYSKLRFSVLVYNNGNKYFIKYRNNFESLKDDEFLTKNFDSKKLQKKKKNTISKLKLAELQKIAISKGIDIKKMGKKQKINKTKSELINEISN